MIRVRSRIVALALAALCLAGPLAAQDDEGDPGSGETVKSRLDGGRIVGVGENLGRDKRATVLNYVLYGGRVYQDGKPTLVLHKMERTSPKSGLLSSDTTVRNSLIISYQYVQPDVIYLQGVWMKVLEFDNTHLRFIVLKDRKPFNAPE